VFVNKEFAAFLLPDIKGIHTLMYTVLTLTSYKIDEFQFIYLKFFCGTGV
jgi:hypothetical protein